MLRCNATTQLKVLNNYGNNVVWVVLCGKDLDVFVGRVFLTVVPPFTNLRERGSVLWGEEHEAITNNTICFLNSCHSLLLWALVANERERTRGLAGVQ